MGCIHELFPYTGRVHRALNARNAVFSNELRNVDHRRVRLRVAHPHSRSHLLAETYKPRVGVVILRARFARCRAIIFQWRAPCGTKFDNTLQRVDCAKRHIRCQHLFGGQLVTVQLDAVVLDALDEIWLHVNATVGNGLHS